MRSWGLFIILILWGGFSYSNPTTRSEDILKQMSLDEKLSLLGGAEDGFTIPAQEKYQIPALKMTDGPVGIRMGKGIAYPAAIALAATFNEDLAHGMAQAIGQETLASGKNILLGPCVNIARIPLGGRVFESYGEDPYLAGEIAKNYIQGLQGTGVMASVKHFALNNQEFQRDKVNVEIDEKVFHEIYLPAFQAAIDAGSATVMASYNKIRGEYASENTYLLNDILKKEMGFRGFVISDWGATHSTVKSALSGLDVEMPYRNFFAEPLKQAVLNNEISMELINDKAGRVLWAMEQLNYFDPRKPAPVDWEYNKQVALHVAHQSIVLLKNKNDVLPLDFKHNLKVAVIGPSADVARTGGGGSSYLTPPQDVLSPLQALQQRIQENSGKLKINYAQGTSMESDPYKMDSDLFSTMLGINKMDGLKGEYFNNPNLEGDPIFTRVDKDMQFDWGWTSPDGLPGDWFSVRWTGAFEPRVSGEHEFIFTADDGVRFYVNDKLVLDAWENASPQGGLRVLKYHQDFVAGEQYNIRIEYIERENLSTFYLGLREPVDGILPDESQDAVELAKKSDVAIIFAGLNSKLESESFDRKDFSLPQDQVELIQKVSQANPNTIVVIEAGSPVDLSWQDKVAGLLYAWYPGEQGALAMSDVLLGIENPSGKLPVTIPRRLEDVPAMKYYPGENAQETYTEGMHVGYRGIKNAAYDFGYGLSYSQFALSNLDLDIGSSSAKNPDVTVTVDLSNFSDRDGAEVVQLYLQHPKTQDFWNLKKFQKVLLPKNSTQKVTFHIDRKAFEQFDKDSNAWTILPGTYKIQAKIGSQIKDLRGELSLKP